MSGIAETIVENNSSGRSFRRPLSGVEKVATILLTMSKEYAANVLSQFDPDEVRVITRSAAQLGFVDIDLLNDVVKEFMAKFSDGSGIFGSVGEIQRHFQGILPEEQIKEIALEVADLRAQDIWSGLNGVSENVLANYLSQEHPQTAALILSKISSINAAHIMQLLPQELRSELVRRMLAIKPVVQETLSEIETVLRRDFMANFSGAVKSDSFTRMASILNSMERDQMDEMLTSLTRARPTAADVLRGHLFTFEDIVRLNERAKSVILDEVSTDQLVLALKGTDMAVRDAVLSTLPSRSRNIVEQELKLEIPVPQRDVLDARRAITERALELSDQGEIDLVDAEENAGAYLK